MSRTDVIITLTGIVLMFAGCGEEQPVEDIDVPIEHHVQSQGAGSLIPRNVLFGNPENMAPQLSPDGDRIAFIAPAEGVLNLWVMNIDGTGRRQLTFDDNRGVFRYFWAENGQQILYMQDEAGEENTHVYLLDVDSGDLTDLTPYDGVKAYVSATDEDQPDRVLIEMNVLNPMFFSVYSCDLTTGELTLLQENPGMTENGDMVLGYITDESLAIRGYATINPENGWITFFVRETPGSDWSEFASFSSDDAIEPRRFSEDGTGLYYTSNLESSTTQLFYRDLASGEETRIAGDSLADVGGVAFDPFTGKPRAVSFHYLRRDVEVLDESIRDDYEFLADYHPGDFGVSSSDAADSTWIVVYFTVQNPATYFVYDRTAAEMSFLFTAIPALEDVVLADMEPLLIPSRDGLQLPCYLTLPINPGDEPMPLILYVHGGPWARDYYGYEPFVQLFANRGFAVLQVNFRGSSGFGKEFENAGNREWGAAMQDDLTDAVQWAIDEGFADPERVVILGGSYGGYATLAGLTFTPDLYCAGVDFFGPSNLITFLETVPPYWKPMSAIMDVRIGSLTEDTGMLEERSPLNYVDNIHVPLFVVQGRNDPRVVQAESDQMVEALRAIGTEVLYVIYDNEGHGFAMEPNRLDFAGRVEEFLFLNVPGLECELFQPVEGSTANVIF
jgi:dipeptidyl aminopeptidase/acylaminoacyl peptidase